MKMELLEEELRSLQIELDETKDVLFRTKSELETSKRLAKEEMEKVCREMADLQRSTMEQLKVSRFGLERFSTDSASIKFYTGFPTYSHLKIFFELARRGAEFMKYCYASGERGSRPASRQLQQIDELFLFLVRLKLGLFEQDLADRFQMNISSISRKLTTWANYLYFLLGSKPIWPTRECIQKYMPHGFRRMYPATRVIIDCTEIFVQTPSSLLLQSHSSYKSNTTMKGLIGITPHGAISFVSSLYTGSISDKEITRCSGILELLEPGDAVMADKGFDVEDLLKEKGVVLNIPPFLQKQTQFKPVDVQETKTIAKLRIHVERAIRRIKEYHFF
ncbi:uncharacterized protein LOC135693131 [Rhopilema esculentum]|uniref:uncharacterized protein LOC135693131 n=1 Tax=Rhopilema esculentum TaxID=499914 RepID=UPI0031DC3E38